MDLQFKVTDSWIKKTQFLTKKDFNTKASHQKTGFVAVFTEAKSELMKDFLKLHVPNQLTKTVQNSDKEIQAIEGIQGPVWIVKLKNSKASGTHYGLMDESEYAKSRDLVGSVGVQLKSASVEKVVLHFNALNENQILGALVGLEMAAYQFKDHLKKKVGKDLPQLQVFSAEVENAIMQKAIHIAYSVNLARHFVNTPPNILNPQTMSEAVVSLFKNQKNTKVEIWNTQRLKKENMNLHVAVGQGAEFGPCMVHIQYRPGKGSSKLKPIAFVGKGVTFDSGGLDIKPSSGMRLMKKDMGGSAAVLGLCAWAIHTQYSRPLDFYLGLAENSVDAKSFRPSDVIKARNGDYVEIHNTDAEGRLVLADCLDVAVTRKAADEPELVIDVATLTGAIKVALGADMPGLFCNSDKVADQLLQAGQKMGDSMWRMPLVKKYNSQMNSAFADYTNCVDGFGGAITAALFLEKFVKNKPWAHLDIYAWNDRPQGPLSFAGGSGQAVQALIGFLQNYK